MAFDIYSNNYPKSSQGMCPVEIPASANAGHEHDEDRPLTTGNEEHQWILIHTETMVTQT